MKIILYNRCIFVRRYLLVGGGEGFDVLPCWGTGHSDDLLLDDTDTGSSSDSNFNCSCNYNFNSDIFGLVKRGALHLVKKMSCDVNALHVALDCLSNLLLPHSRIQRVKTMAIEWNDMPNSSELYRAKEGGKGQSIRILSSGGKIFLMRKIAFIVGPTQRHCRNKQIATILMVF